MRVELPYSSAYFRLVRLYRRGSVRAAAADVDGPDGTEATVDDTAGIHPP